MILSPVPTGQWLHLDYYSGCRYVALKSREANQVNIFVLIIKYSKKNSPKVTVTFHEARPESLVYQDHNFHVMDLQVILDNKISLHSCNIFLIALSMSPHHVWGCRRGTPQHWAWAASYFQFGVFFWRQQGQGLIYFVSHLLIL